MHWLSLSIWVPIAFGALLLALGREDQVKAVRWLALVGALAGLAVTLPLIQQFDNSTAAMQFVEKALWIERFNIHYHLGVDGISFWFVPLTAFITVIVVIASWEHHRAREPVHGRLPDPVRPDGRRVQRAGRPAVLRVLRGHADPDVPDHRHLGRSQPHLCGLQVLPVHADGFAADPGRRDLPVHPVGWQLRDPRLAQAAAVHDGPDADLLRLLRGLCREGADVAGPHLAARRAWKRPPAAPPCWPPSC